MILEIINLWNKIKLMELSEYLGVLEDIVWCDFCELVEGGFIKKVYGGVLANFKMLEVVYC